MKNLSFRGSLLNRPNPFRSLSGLLRAVYNLPVPLQENPEAVSLSSQPTFMAELRIAIFRAIRNNGAGG